MYFDTPTRTFRIDIYNSGAILEFFSNTDTENHISMKIRYKGPSRQKIYFLKKGLNVFRVKTDKFKLWSPQLEVDSEHLMKVSIMDTKSGSPLVIRFVIMDKPKIVPSLGFLARIGMNKADRRDYFYNLYTKSYYTNVRFKKHPYISDEWNN